MPAAVVAVNKAGKNKWDDCCRRVSEKGGGRGRRTWLGRVCIFTKVHQSRWGGEHLRKGGGKTHGCQGGAGGIAGAKVQRQTGQ